MVMMVHTKDFMPLLPSLLPFPKVNTRCIMFFFLLLNLECRNVEELKKGMYVFIYSKGWMKQIKLMNSIQLKLDMTNLSIS